MNISPAKIAATYEIHMTGLKVHIRCTQLRFQVFQTCLCFDLTHGLWNSLRLLNGSQTLLITKVLGTMTLSFDSSDTNYYNVLIVVES